MRFYELQLNLILNEDFHYKDIFQILTRYVNFILFNNKDERERHPKNQFKYYTFNTLYPIEKDKLYKKDKNYSFNIRSLDENFIDNIKDSIKNEKVNNLKVISSTKRVIYQKFIDEIISITPIVTTITKDDKTYYWTIDRDGDIMKLMQGLQDNLIKKYNSFFSEEIELYESFIKTIEVLNKKPIKMEFVKNDDKRFFFLGNKLKVRINEDSISQKLAFIALACGLGEKNSYGGGYCRVKYNSELEGLVK